MVKRSRLEISFDILVAIEKGFTRPTRIMYQTGLAWTSLQDILETLLKSGFIQEEKTGKIRTYRVTDKGRSALSFHLKATNGFSIVEETFNI